METEVQIGKIEVAKGSDCLTASGVGSCLIITLYDPKHKIGALAHAMLPNHHTLPVVSDLDHGSRVTNHESQDTKYVDVAIDELVKRMEVQSTKREDVEAKLIGGANMFPAFESDIGKENVLFLTKISSFGKKILAGFGISEKYQIEAISEWIHAAIVGTAFIKEIMNSSKDSTYNVIKKKIQSLV